MIDIANWIFAASLFIVTFRKKAMRLIGTQLDRAPISLRFLLLSSHLQLHLLSPTSPSEKGRNNGYPTPPIGER